MSDPVRLEFTNLLVFNEAFNRGPDVVAEELFASGRKIAKLGEEMSDTYLTRDWRGETRNSIWSRADKSGGAVEIAFGAKAKHAIVVDQGRRAGAKMPPQGAMLPWMADRGIPEDREFVLRRAIGRLGIAARPFVTKAFEELKSGIVQRELGAGLRRAIRRIAGTS